MAIVDGLLIVLLVLLPVAAFLIVSQMGEDWLTGRLCGGVRFQEFQAEPVDENELPQSVAQFFGQHTGEMLGLGFECLGDYRLIHAPGVAHSRFFVSGDRRELAAIEVCGSKRTYALFSVFEDGTFLQSSPMRARKLPATAEVPLEYHHVPGASVEQLWQEHAAAAEQYERDHDCKRLKIEPERWGEVAAYAHRLDGWRLCSKGMSARPPMPLGREQVRRRVGLK